MARAATTAIYRAPEWLPDDTEESIVGTEWHQEAIGALATMLRAIREQHETSWGVCEQIELSGLQRPNGTPYSPRPDVMVLKQPLSGDRAAITLTEAGAPLFIAEIASTTTVRNDREGKKEVYAAIGVPEYLLFDPVGNVLRSPVIAWRLASSAATEYVPWEPQADGWWRSRVLEVAFCPAAPFLQVRGRDGLLLDTPLGAIRRAQQLEQELRAEQTARQAEQAARQAEQAARQAERRERQRLEDELHRLRQAHDETGDAPPR